MRPRESWPLSRVIYVKLLRRLNIVVSHTGPLWSTPDHITVAKGMDIKHAWLDPVPHLLTPEMKTWAEHGDVQPISIPGYRLNKVGIDIPIGAPPTPGEKVVYTLHGGDYIWMSASPTDLMANIARGVLKHCAPAQRILSVQYRLSRAAPDPPANPFPATLVDALVGYVYLTNTVGFAPEKSKTTPPVETSRYLVENVGTPGLPRGAVLLLSPWADMSQSDYQPGTSSYTCANSDYIVVSPASVNVAMKPVSFDGWPRTLVVAGKAELLRDQRRVLVGKIRADMEEGQLKYYESPDSTHDFLLFPFHEPERTQTLEEIAHWMSSSSEPRPGETIQRCI